jgi:hypothetical protein
VGAKPSRGCSHRRVPCDPTLPGFAYGDMEEAMLRAGYAPDVPSMWVLQEVVGRCTLNSTDPPTPRLIG